MLTDSTSLKVQLQRKVLLHWKQAGVWFLWVVYKPANTVCVSACRPSVHRPVCTSVFEGICRAAEMRHITDWCCRPLCFTELAFLSDRQLDNIQTPLFPHTQTHKGTPTHAHSLHIHMHTQLWLVMLVSSRTVCKIKRNLWLKEYSKVWPFGQALIVFCVIENFSPIWNHIST